MNFLSDRDKIIFASVNHTMRFFLNKLHYIELHNYEYVKKLYYFECFNRVSHKLSNEPIPKIVTDLIIKCGYNKPLTPPQHIKHITVCGCVRGEIKVPFNNKIIIKTNNKLCKCNYFPRNDNKNHYFGALYELTNNSAQDPHINVDVSKSKNSRKIKYNSPKKYNKIENVSKYTKCVRNHYKY
ncbi:F-box and FNIP repeat-containing protein [Cotonvirus japonicus]|uniref:F-box and FNIP repeat-containing protein n=1 Tax=Cotonvirus japonicus TaxID=2811091 RepID=A0ABM7NU22_9VIRU|nr:F-box and FNIP repeat-containing protein [Cotonvirus japonicus]BCS83665.1 F-box and FNIP repeat-containing protein [Cotonvirus japonicus]